MRKILLTLTILVTITTLARGQTNTNQVVEVKATNAPPVVASPPAAVAPAPVPAPQTPTKIVDNTITQAQVKELVRLGRLLASGQMDEHKDYNPSQVRDRLDQLQDAIQFERVARKNMAQYIELLQLLDQSGLGRKE